MKKIFIFFLVNSSILVFSQIIANENFNSLTLGNLVPDTTGSLGQNDYFANIGLVSEYQVVDIDASKGKSVQFTNSTGGTDNDDRLAFKNISVNADPGNNILKGTLEIFTGNNDGDGIIECVLYDSNNFGIVGIGYSYDSKKIVGRGRYSHQVPGGSISTDFFTVELSSGPGNKTYPANTWVPVSFTYNKTTGAFEWTNPEGSYHYPDPAFVPVAGLTPAKFSLGSNVLSNNSSANTAAIDNLVLMFTNTTLSTKDISTVKTQISIYPNPASDFITVKSDSEVKNIVIYDISGKRVNSFSGVNSINVKSLLPGAYLMKIETKEGTTTKKIIKK